MRKILLTILLFLSPALALPGSPAPASVTRDIHNLRSDQKIENLVLIRSVTITKTSDYLSQSGKKHLRFDFMTSEGAFGGIFYSGDSTETQRNLLQKAVLNRNPVQLVGYWDSFQGQPSFLLKGVMADPEKPSAPPQPVPAPSAPKQSTNTESASPNVPQTAPSTTLKQIRNAKIDTSSITKFFRNDQKIEIRYRFIVDGKTYAGVLQPGDWNSDTLQTLRSGQATLKGQWDTRDPQKPVFVTVGVE